MTAVRRRLTGTFDLAMPRTEAFGLFTPEGERSWVPAWDPRILDDAGDGTEPGSVFETCAHGEQTTWVVAGREPGHMMAYARVTPGVRAGTVTVTVDDTDIPRHCRVTVTYDLTALSAAARPELDEFARSFPDFLRSWKGAIEDAKSPGGG